MNKELQKLLKQINDKKNEVKSLVNDGKLDKARAAKEELVELQNRFDLLYDLDEVSGKPGGNPAENCTQYRRRWRCEDGQGRHQRDH